MAAAIDRLVRYVIYIHIYLLLSAANKLDHVLSLLIINGDKERSCNGRKDCGGRFATYLGSNTAYHVYLDEQDADAIVP